jgi:hypothetical protein
VRDALDPRRDQSAANTLESPSREAAP